jgi:hypothetical protein
VRRATWRLAAIVGLIIVTGLGAVVWIASVFGFFLLMRHYEWAAVPVVVVLGIALAWIAMPSIGGAVSSLRVSEDPFRHPKQP